MFPQPKAGITLYTKSKCSYCTKAKQNFPKAKVINCDNYLSVKRNDFLAFIDTLTDKKPRTFPMVFKDKEYLGGHDDTKHLGVNNFNLKEYF